MPRTALLAVAAHWAASQQTYFEVLQFRSPSQCERMQCLSVRQENCREHSKGFYLKEKACNDGEICTDCEQGMGSNPTVCKCELPPYSVPATYGQECNTGKVCTEGLCFRPCHTYLHSTLCPSTHCQWEPHGKLCEPKPEVVPVVYWMKSPAGLAPLEQGKEILAVTTAAAYPIDFESFRESAVGYRVHGHLLESLTTLEKLFLKLDMDMDGGLDTTEYAKLPDLLDELGQAALSGARRLQAQRVTPEICNAQRPRKFYCSFDDSCKEDCRECGWKSATDEAFSTCVRPTPIACAADGGQVFCPSDELCHPSADCSKCADRPIVDHSQHMCVALWWSPDPLPQWSNWVCRDRNKVGMPCRYDQDCIYGLRRCVSGVCQPLEPYNPEQICDSDYDCPHLNHYCPVDPTGGLNPYWIKYCRSQRVEGETCSEDRECSPDLGCNVEEPLPRCRRRFSLPIGTPAADDTFCEFGWRDRDNKCTVAAHSKAAGRDCDTDQDCETTDSSGRPGRCVCKAWWDTDDAKYCLPVAGDYANTVEKLRDWVWFKAQLCGSFWTEEECLHVFGNEALRLKLAVECETQQLSGGPHLPPASCGIVDEERFPDPCMRLQNLG